MVIAQGTINCKPNWRTQVKIKPFGDKVLIRRAEDVTTTAGGLSLPSKQIKTEGTVLDVGDGILNAGKFIQPRVKKGDRVIWTGGHIQIDPTDEGLILITEQSIVAILSD